MALDTFGFFGEEFFVGGTEFAGIEDAVDGLGDFLVVRGFLDEVGEVGVAVWVEEAEAGEVAVGAQLLGRGGEEEEAFDFGGELLDDLVFGAGLVGVPLEVVGFVNDEEIPAGFEDLGGAGFGGGEKGEAGEDELGIEEGVDAFVVVLNGLAAVFVKETEEEIEAAEEFDEPLMEEGVGDEDEDAGGAAGELEAMKDEAGLDGFAEADFVSEEDAGEEAAGDFTGDGHLMRDQVNAATEEAAGGGAAEGAAAFEGAEAEFEGAGVVDLTGEEAILRFAEADGVGELGFVDFAVVGLVDDEAVFFRDGGDGVLKVVVSFDGVADLEADAAEGGGLEGVLAVFVGSGEEDLEPAEAGFEDHAESEFWFCVTDPSLPCCRSVH